VDTRTGIAEDVMRREYPRTYRYLQQFAPLLRSRAAYRRYQGQKPFYSMYNVGPYTVAPIKVVWRRMERMIRAAVVEPLDDPLLGRRPLVPQETCVLIACASAEEAHYLCAVLNSERVNALVAAHSVVGGKGFGTPGMLEYLGLRRFDSRDRRHAALAAYSRRAHELNSRRHTPCVALECRHTACADYFTDGASPSSPVEVVGAGILSYPVPTRKRGFLTELLAARHTIASPLFPKAL
jgi:hypothetical protein